MTAHATLDQLRARHAWGVVDEVRHMHGSAPMNFAREVKRLPVRIRTAGLGQALGFLYAKSKEADVKSRLLTELGTWLLDKRGLAARPNGATHRNAVIRAIMDGDADLLRRATEEALLYLQWLTRFAEAELAADGLDD